MQTQKQLIQSLENPEQIQLARIGCPGKATGGRKDFEGQNLQACAIKGAQNYASTDPKNLSPGDQRNFKNLTKKTAQGESYENIFLGPAAQAYEAAFAFTFALYDYQADLE